MPEREREREREREKGQLKRETSVYGDAHIKDEFSL